MAAISETPLTGLTGWSDDDVRRLARVWITSAEQVVGLAATPGGLTSLAEQLGTTEQEADRLLDAARSALPERVRADLEVPVDPREYQTGVLPPRPEEGRPD